MSLSSAVYPRSGSVTPTTGIYEDDSETDQGSRALDAAWGTLSANFYDDDGHEDDDRAGLSHTDSSGDAGYMPGSSAGRGAVSSGSEDGDGGDEQFGIGFFPGQSVEAPPAALRPTRAESEDAGYMPGSSSQNTDGDQRRQDARHPSSPSASDSGSTSHATLDAGTTAVATSAGECATEAASVEEVTTRETDPPEKQPNSTPPDGDSQAPLDAAAIAAARRQRAAELLEARQQALREEHAEKEAKVAAYQEARRKELEQKRREGKLRREQLTTRSFETLRAYERERELKRDAAITKTMDGSWKPPPVSTFDDPRGSATLSELRMRSATGSPAFAPNLSQSRFERSIAASMSLSTEQPPTFGPELGRATSPTHIGSAARFVHPLSQPAGHAAGFPVPASRHRSPGASPLPGLSPGPSVDLGGTRPHTSPHLSRTRRKAPASPSQHSPTPEDSTAESSPRASGMGSLPRMTFAKAFQTVVGADGDDVEPEALAPGESGRVVRQALVEVAEQQPEDHGATARPWAQQSSGNALSRPPVSPIASDALSVKGFRKMAYLEAAVKPSLGFPSPSEYSLPPLSPTPAAKWGESAPKSELEKIITRARYTPGPAEYAPSVTLTVPAVLGTKWGPPPSSPAW